MRVYPHFVFTGFSNCYLVAPDGPGEAALIDPGIFDGELLKLIENNKLYISKILITHTHESHIEGIKTLSRIYDIEVYAFRDKVLDFETKAVRQNQQIKCGDLTFEVIELPGHSRDSLAFKIANYQCTSCLTSSYVDHIMAYAQSRCIFHVVYA